MIVKIKKIDDNFINIKVNYSPKNVEKIKKIKGRRWNSQHKLWIIPNNQKNLNDLIAFFGEDNISLAQLYLGYNFKKEHLNRIQLKELIRVMIKRLKLNGYSKKTIKVYSGHVRRFLQFNKRNSSNKKITEEDIENYLFNLLDSEDLSHSYVNQAVSAMKFLFNNVLTNYSLDINISRPKKMRKLPVVLSQNEVFNILNALKNIKHKTILYLTYSAGLRVSEVVQLKLKDIDSKRMLVHIRQGKGRKDRYTILSKEVLKIS